MELPRRQSMKKSKNTSLENSKSDNTVSSTTNIKKAKCAKRTQVLGESVLLNYTYYLDAYHNRKVLVGFDPNDFNAKIVFHLHGRFPVSTDYIGWVSLYDHLKELKTQLVEPQDDNGFEVNKKVYKIPVGIGRITLKKYELLKLYEIMELLNIVMFHNNNAVGGVKEYYKKYCLKCGERNVLQLTANDYFPPSGTSCTYVNYTRLFYEIPFIRQISIADILFESM